MKAARVIANLLQRAGVRHVFCVPGESYLALLDELAGRSGLQVVTARHESGAGFMADGYVKATGGIGVAMASRGPGALNLAIALHQAEQDATPLVAFIGQVGTGRRGRGAFQEIDVSQVFGPMVKWAVEVERPDRVGEVVSRALAVARSGRPGPVVVMAGDGGFLMTASELATAVRLRLPVVALVFNNGLYGTIYAHQRRRTDDPARLSVNTLVNPDFADLARSFGAYGEQVADNAAFGPALQRALQAGGPAVLELRVNPERLHALAGPTR